MQPKSIRFVGPDHLARSNETTHVLEIAVSAVYGSSAVLVLPGNVKGAINLFKLPPGVFDRCRPGHVNVHLSFVDDVDVAHKRLVNWLAGGSEGLIKLSAVCKGASAKSKKVTVDGVAYRHGKWRDEYANEERKSHQLTVPASMIKYVGDEAYMTRWYLMRLVHERILAGGSWPDDIEGGVFMESDLLWTELFEPFKRRLQAMAAAYSVEREAQKARDEALRKTQLEAARARPPQPTADQLAATKLQQKAARLASLPVIRPTWIEWDESIESKDARGNKRYTKETFRDEGCEVRVSGQRVYVRFSDGAEMIKMRQNIRWFGGENEKTSQV